MKLKIKPSAKINRRYLLLQAKSKKDVEKAILEYIGVLGWAEAAPLFVKSTKMILAIDRSALTKVRAAFELSPYRITIQKVSGTLAGLK